MPDTQSIIASLDQRTGQLEAQKQSAEQKVAEARAAVIKAGADPNKAKEEYTRVTAEIKDLEVKIAADQEKAEQWLKANQ